MKRLPKSVKRLTWGTSMFFFNGLDVCVHSRQSYFNIINCTTDEVTKVNIKHAYQFIGCNKTNRLIFAQMGVRKVDYSKPHPYNAGKPFVYFYVYDLNSGTYKRTKAFSRSYPLSERMSTFFENGDDIVTVINSNGDIFTVNINSLEIELIMSLSELEYDANKFVYNWYKTGLDTYETATYKRKFWYPIERAKQTDNFMIAKVDLSKKTLDYRPCSGGPYDNSIYLHDFGIWVHLSVNESDAMSKSAPMHFEIRMNDEIIYKFEIPCSPFYDGRLFFSDRNIVSFTKDSFVICFSQAIYLCNVKDFSLKSIFLDDGMADVFFDKERGHIVPIYFMGATKEMFTLDDFSS